MGWLQRLVAFEGSTRAVGLMRIGAGLLLWSRFAREMMPLRELELDRLVISAVFYVSTTAMVVGFATPVAMAVVSALLGVMVLHYGVAHDPEGWSHHHVHLHMLSTWWLALTPCGRSFSVDRWLAQRRASRRGLPAPREWGPLWATRLIGVQLGTLYFWSAIDKLQQHYWTGERLQHLIMNYYTGAALPDPWWFTALLAATGTFVVVLELVLPWGLFVRRLQPVLIPMGIVLHLLFYVLIPVNTFSLLMICLYLAYLPPDSVHRFIDRWLGHEAGSTR